MATPSRFRFRFPWRSKASIERAVDEELQFHIDMRTAELAATGIPEPDARATAVREFGDVEFTRRYCRGEDLGAERRIRLADRLDELRGNVVYAVRSLKRSPGFTAVALTTLALAIGANTAVFSVANATLLTPLPYGRPAELVTIYENNTTNGAARTQMSAGDLVDYRESQRSFTGLGWFTPRGVALRDGAAEPLVIRAVYASANLFEVLGARALRGRTFAPDEDTPAKIHVAIISQALWQRAFGGDSTAVGHSVAINDVPFEIIGVMPADFSLGFAEDVWLPADVAPVVANVNRARKFHWLFGVGRLKPGATVESASADLNATAHALAQKYPAENGGHFVTVVPMQAAIIGDARKTTFVLLGAAALVLLIAAANLINMMLARAVARRRELTVRAAIGAGRGHLIRQLLTESLVLSLAGGVLGAALAVAGVRLIAAYGAGILPPIAHVRLDWLVLAFCFAVSLVIGVLLGVVPAFGALRFDLNAALQESSRGSAGDRRGERLRGGLVFAQIATAVVLLATAGLLVRSLVALNTVALGFEPSHLMTATAGVTGPRYQTNDARDRFYDAVFAQLRATPGIGAVGSTSSVPLVGGSTCGLTIEGRPAPAQGYFEARCAGIRGDYFKAIGAAIVAGRDFDATDLPNGPKVAIINAALAKRFFPNEDPLGKRIRLGPNPSLPWGTIIGVVGDMRDGSLDADPSPMAFEFDTQSGWNATGIVVRAAGDPAAAMPAIRAAVRAVDPNIAMRNVSTIPQIIGGSLATRRFSLGVILSFALLALVLSAVGVYGVLAYMVTSRSREFGVRMALGANAGTVRALVLRKGLSWSVAGLAVGIGVSLAGGRWIEGMLFQVHANDVPTFVAVGAFLFSVVLAACIVPARRATRVDPIVALRQE